MEFLRMFGSWTMVGIGFGTMVVFGAASIGAIVREHSLPGGDDDDNWDRRAWWRRFGLSCIDMAASGGIVGVLASMLMAALWAVT